MDKIETYVNTQYSQSYKVLIIGVYDLKLIGNLNTLLEEAKVDFFIHVLVTNEEDAVNVTQEYNRVNTILICHCKTIDILNKWKNKFNIIIVNQNRTISQTKLKACLKPNGKLYL